MTLAVAFTVAADGTARGHVADPGDPTRRFVVELLADGLPLALVRAHRFSPACAALRFGDSCYGFSYGLPDAVLARAVRLEARLANTGELVGAVTGEGRGLVRSDAGAVGHARWAGGLRITGWVEDDGEDTPWVRAVVDGLTAARAPCDAWTFRPDPGARRAVRSFNLCLPAALADGRVRAVGVETDRGEVLAGSPCLAVAFADGLAGVVERAAEVESERLRARFADGLLPQSLPFSSLDGWLARFPLPQAEARARLRVVLLLTGEAGLDDTLASLDRETGVDWSVAVLAGGAGAAGFKPGQVVAALAADPSGCDLAVAAPSGTRFSAGALPLLHDGLRRHPRAALAYGDLVVERDGQRWPLGFPAYDEERALEQGYCGLVFAFRPEAAARVPDGCDNLYGVCAGLCDADPDAAPVHLPVLVATLPPIDLDEVRPALLHATRARLAARGAAAATEIMPGTAFPAVRVRRPPPPGEVSVVVAVRDGAEDLGRTLDALEGTPPGRLVLADNETTEPGARALLERAARSGHTVVPVPGWFSLARVLNAGAAAARGDHLLFLASGTVPGSADWLDEMLGRLAGTAVGAVGALVGWGAGVVRHAGLVLGPRLSAVARFTDRLLGDDGYGGLLKAAHRCSAVSSACMLTPRRLFASLGGFDAVRFSIRHHDVDYCLRLRARGFHTVLTPHARLVCDAPDRLPPDETAWADLAAREDAVLRETWGLAPGRDPYYSPWLNGDGPPYSGLAWPPAPFAARQPAALAARPVPPGF